MNKSAPTSGFFRWPVPALIVWAAGWLCYGFLLREDVPTVAAMLLSVLTGFAASAVAWKRGVSRARLLALALGFPVSLLLSGAATLPAWVWLLPLALALLVYPMHAWRDAPVFPTPLQA